MAAASREGPSSPEGRTSSFRQQSWYHSSCCDHVACGPRHSRRRRSMIASTILMFSAGRSVAGAAAATRLRGPEKRGAGLPGAATADPRARRVPSGKERMRNSNCGKSSDGGDGGEDPDAKRDPPIHVHTAKTAVSLSEQCLNTHISV